MMKAIERNKIRDKAFSSKGFENFSTHDADT